MDPLLAVHLAVTAALTGLIWTVQIVHYPLFARVDRAAFEAYHHAHLRRVTLVVAPLMLTEAGTAVWLLVRAPAPLSFAAAAVGVGLVLVIWLSTALLQVPCHHRLEASFDERAHRRLVGTNWIRTVAWSARTALLVSAAVGG